jgi:hypothetical protein
MKIKHLLSILVLISFYKLANPAAALAAPRIYFEPSQKTVASGETLTISVKVDTSGEETKGANASINYPTENFEFVSVSGGSFYNDAQTNSEPGKGWIYLDGMQTNPTNKSGTGIIGSFSLKALANGTAKITVDCAQSTVLSADNANIIDCASTSGGDYIIGAGSSQPEPTNPPPTQPTSPPSNSSLPPTNTPPSELPKSGNILDTAKAIGAGIGFVIIGLVLLL